MPDTTTFYRINARAALDDDRVKPDPPDPPDDDDDNDWLPIGGFGIILLALLFMGPQYVFYFKEKFPKKFLQNNEE